MIRVNNQSIRIIKILGKRTLIKKNSKLITRLSYLSTKIGEIQESIELKRRL